MEVDQRRDGARTWWTDSLLVFAFGAMLVAPLFKTNYQDSWASIESTFIADARFLRDHHYAARWQPEWYCGTRWDYVYPPALRYGTALISSIGDVNTARAYHLYIAFFYALGIVGVYWLVRTGTGSRWWGLTAAVAAALVSPSYLFIRDVYHDARAAGLPPQRLNVLVRYGEGPHITSVAWLGIALACAWRGLRRDRPGWLALTALSMAAVVSNNFYGATALAMLIPVMVWTIYVTQNDRGVWWRAAAAGALGYGLTAFWLTPSYLKLTLYNMRHVSQSGSGASVLLGGAVVVMFLRMSWRRARGRADAAWTVFVAGAFALFSLNVLGHHFFNFRVIGEPGRLIPELDLIMILAALLVCQHLWRNARIPRWAFLVPVLAVLVVTRFYWWHPHRIYTTSDETTRIEYKMTQWISEHMPGERVFATGSLRFWYNAWFDGAMVGGGSEQGLLNQYAAAIMWVVRLDPNPLVVTQWLQAMGADAIAIHEKRSQEIYKDIEQTGKFQGAFERIYDSGNGDFIYRVPRRYPGLARVVDTKALEALQPMRVEGDSSLIGSYADVLENGPAVKPEFRWEGTDRMRVHVKLEPGQTLVVQETWDPAWRARTERRELTVRQSLLQFMRIDAAPGEHEIVIEFGTPIENRVGRGLAAASLIALAALAWKSQSRKHAT